MKLVLLASTAAIVLLTASSSPAADVDRSTTIELNGTGAKGLKIAAVRPATKSGARVTLPWSSMAGGVRTHMGAVRLSVGKRSVTLTKITYGQGAVKATIGRKRITLLEQSHYTGALVGTFRGSSSVGTLTKQGGTAIRKALKLKRTPTGKFAVVRLIAVAQAPAPAPAPAPPQPDNPVSGCPGGPAPLARPTTAVNVTAATLQWHVRESFVRYINGGQGMSVEGDATAGTPQVIAPASIPLIYDYFFKFKAGWTDAASGQSRLLFTGRVNLRWNAHKINLAMTDPEIEIAGAGSRAIYCSANLATPGESLKRSVLVNLDSSGGTSQMKGIVPKDAADDTFAGYYLPGDEFGWYGVTGVTP